jgi:hypothetical protein
MAHQRKAMIFRTRVGHIALDKSSWVRSWVKNWPLNRHFLELACVAAGMFLAPSGGTESEICARRPDSSRFSSSDRHDHSKYVFALLHCVGQCPSPFDWLCFFPNAFASVIRTEHILSCIRKLFAECGMCPRELTKGASGHEMARG